MLIDPKNPHCRATQTEPKWELLKDPNEPFAIDIEFQEFRKKGAIKWGHRIGRISIVNTRGQVIYDTYVRYEYDEDMEVKMPPKRFGVTWADIKIPNGAKPIFEVEENLHKIMHGRTIVGHGMRLDIGAISSDIWANCSTVDTQHIYGQVALWKLAANHLGQSIQGDFHDPAEDATATMLLYLRVHPFQKRTSFKEPDFVLVEEEFPALGAAKNKKH